MSVCDTDRGPHRLVFGKEGGANRLKRSVRFSSSCVDMREGDQVKQVLLQQVVGVQLLLPLMVQRLSIDLTNHLLLLCISLSPTLAGWHMTTRLFRFSSFIPVLEFDEGLNYKVNGQFLMARLLLFFDSNPNQLLWDCCTPKEAQREGTLFAG